MEMDNSILSTVGASFLAISEVFILIAIGYFSTRKRIVRPEVADNLSELIIYVTLPVMIFSRIISGFEFGRLNLWWIFPLLSIGMILFSFILAEITARFFRIQTNRLEFKSLVAFQNSGYLPLALVSGLLKPPESDMAILYILFFLTGFNFLIWSWGVAILKTRRENERMLWFKFFSPPFIATAAALILVFTGVNKFMPDAFIKPLRMLGDSTIPLGLFVVGGALAGFNITRRIKFDFLGVVFLRLILIPLIFLGLLHLVKLPHIISLIILLEAAMPSATSLVVIAKVYGENYEYISKGILITHLISLLTIPIFLFLFFRIF